MIHRLIRKLARTQFVRDVALLQCSATVVQSLQFVLSIAIARLLGPQEAGLYFLVLAIVSGAGMLTDVGQQHSLTTLLPEAYAREDPIQAKRVLQYYFWTAIHWSIPVSFMMLLIAPVIAEVLYDTEVTIGLWLRLGIAGMIFVPIHEIVALVAQSGRHIKKLAIVDIVFGLADVMLPAVLLLASASVTALLIGRLLSSLFKCVVGVIFWQQIAKKDLMIPSLSSIRPGTFADARSMMPLGLWIAANKQVSNVLSKVPVYLLGIFGAATAIGQYKILMSYIGIAGMFSSSVYRLLTTVLPHIHAKNIARFARSFWMGNIGNMLLHFTLLMPLLALGNSGLTLLYGNAYAVHWAVFPLLLLTAIDGITIGFSTFYRIHRAIPRAIVSQVFAVVTGIVMFFVAVQHVSPVLAAVVLFVTSSTVSKLLHAHNFFVLRYDY